MTHHVLLQTGCHEPLSWQNQIQSDIREAVSIAIEVCGDSARLSGNYVIAMKWWRRAAERGNTSAQMKLAYLMGMAVVAPPQITLRPTNGITLPPRSSGQK